MARPVEIRPNYRKDAAYLLRLEAAVNKDDRHGAKWAEDTAAQLHQLAVRLLQADGRHYGRVKRREA